MYLTKRKKEILAQMVLAHRVAVRKNMEHRTRHGEFDFDLSDNEDATQYALDIALGQAEDWKLQALYGLAGHGNQKADVALIRLGELELL